MLNVIFHITVRICQLLEQCDISLSTRSKKSLFWVYHMKILHKHKHVSQGCWRSESAVICMCIFEYSKGKLKNFPLVWCVWSACGLRWPWLTRDPSSLTHDNITPLNLEQSPQVGEWYEDLFTMHLQSPRALMIAVSCVYSNISSNVPQKQTSVVDVLPPFLMTNYN